MKTQSCKAKGRRLQQLIVKDLLGIFPHLTEDDVRSTSMGAGGEDVLLSPLARRSVPYSIEAKNQERVNVWNALEQAKANAPSGTEPIVVIKKNGLKPHVFLPWEHFLQLLQRPLQTEDSSIGGLTTKEQLSRLANELQLLASNMD